MFPFELELLCLPESGVHRHGNHRPLMLADCVSEVDFFLVRKRTRWLFSLKSFTGRTGFVTTDLAAGNGDVEDALQKNELSIDTRREIFVELRRTARCRRT